MSVSHWVTFLFLGAILVKSGAEVPRFSFDQHDEQGLSLLLLRQLTETLDDRQREAITKSRNEIRDSGDVVNFIRKLLYPKIPTAFSDNVGERCKKDSLDYFNGVLNYTSWALKMYDAAETSSPGVFSGYYHSMGHFDQCLSTRTESFQGKYCTAIYYLLPNGSAATADTAVVRGEPSQHRGLLSILQLLGLSGNQLEKPELLPLQYGLWFTYLPSAALCLPSTCNGTEIRNAFSDLIGSFSVNFNGSEMYAATYTGDEYCYVDTDEPPRFDGADITVICVLSAIGLLVVLSTLYEMVGEYLAGEPLLSSPVARNKKYVQYLCTFSLVNNSRKLLSARTNEGSLGCIHGIRVLSMTWVVLGHTWITVNNGTNLNTSGLMSRIHNWFLQTIFNATVSVDSFFVLSGLLATYLLLKQLDKAKGRINPLMIYLHRYLRLTPVYAIILGFNATLVVYLSSGPFWNNIQIYANGCRTIWWQQLLYINNLFDNGLDKMCMGETWYIAVDTQLFLIMPLIVYPIWRWKVWGLLWLAALTLASFAGNLYMIITANVLPTIMTTRSDGDLGSGFQLYIRPWFRAPSYFAGIFVGWALYETKKRQIKLNKISVTVGWSCAIAVACSVLYGLTPYVTEDVELSTEVRAIYGSFHRFAWSMAIGWMIFACISGYGGYINDLLSWKAFVPLGRLTYCVYLIHLNLLMVYAAQQKNPFYYTELNSIYVYLATLFMAFGLAYIAAVTIETPFLLLEKMLLREKPSKRHEDNQLEKIEVAAAVTKELNGHHNQGYEKTD